MAGPTDKADAKLLTPGVFTGRHPDTGVVHRLTIDRKLNITIERRPYISANADGWCHTYDTIQCDAAKHLFLILKIKANPCDW